MNRKLKIYGDSDRKGSFEVYYQPLYDLKEKKIPYNGSIKPIETSITWNDLTRSFIGIAEKHGQIPQSLGIFNSERYVSS